MKRTYLYGAVALVLLVGAAYFLFVQLRIFDVGDEKMVQNDPTDDPLAEETKNEDVGSVAEEGLEETNASGIRTYRHEVWGIEFQYPAQWGEVRTTLPNQLMITPQGADKHKILIYMSKAEPTGLRIDKIAYLQKDLDCRLELTTYRKLGDESFTIIHMRTMEEMLAQDDCNVLFESFPPERKDERANESHRYTLIFLEESEIPALMNDDYQKFKGMVNSFSGL